MKDMVKKEEMINHIKYNTSAFWGDEAEYFKFEAKWKVKNTVYFKMKHIIEKSGRKNIYYKKGELSFDSSRYFINLVDGIDFKKLKKDCKNMYLIVCDGESNFIKVKTKKYSGRISWDTGAVDSEYISVIKMLVRICERHKESRTVLSIE